MNAAGMEDPLDLDVLETAAAAEALGPEWSLLCAGDPRATPFQSPDWLLPWWGTLGTGELRVATARLHGRLVGVAPFALVPAEEGGPATLSFLGIEVSDYLDVVCDPAHRDRVLPALLGALATRSRWRSLPSRIELAELREGSPLAALAPPPGYQRRAEPTSTCPFIPLPAGPADLRRVLPAHMADNVRYYRRRAERAGAAFVLADPATVGDILEALFDLHTRQWNEKGRGGVLADPAVRAFHRSAAPRLLAGGALRLHAVLIGGRVAGALYALAGHGRVHYYIAGFDVAHRAVSPGTLLIARAIEDALALGATEFDFLRGDEPYKRLWGARDRVSVEVVLEPLVLG